VLWNAMEEALVRKEKETQGWFFMPRKICLKVSELGRLDWGQCWTGSISYRGAVCVGIQNTIICRCKGEVQRRLNRERGPKLGGEEAKQ